MSRVRITDGMGDLGRGGISPVARFSLALAAVLLTTALVLAAGTAYLVERHVDAATIAGIIALGAALPWLILRGVYARSSKRIVAQAAALEDALALRERTYDATLTALTSALDFRDNETGGHSDRVVAYMELLLEQMNIRGAELATLRRGALLHDVGKIGVPDSVLRKPTALSEAEWAVMKRHPEFGARIIAGIPFLEEVARIVRHHHERWDGMGYPDGLKGDRIPLGARIFAVGDSFDAMTSDRPYRRALLIDAAREEIRRCGGAQFDPVAVTAFLSIPVERLAAIADDAPRSHPRVVAS